MLLFQSKLTSMLHSVSVMAIKNKKSPMLRCTLTGIERNYHIRVLSERLYKKEKRFYSTLEKKNAPGINPWFLTGFIDGEGCFRIVRDLITYPVVWPLQTGLSRCP